MIYYTVYKVTNKIDGKFYIGTHKTSDLNDNYMGSGKYLKRAQEKYGIENFEKEIIHVFNNPEEMFAKEAEIVNEEFLALENTYNLKLGGSGGFDYVNSRYWTEDKLNKHHLKVNALRTKLLETKYRECPEIRKRILQGSKKGLAIANNNRANGITSPPFSGKSHKESTKNLISKKAKERLKDPTNNSQYGTMWIHSLEEKKSKKIPKDNPIPEGWIKGRKINFVN